MNSHALSLSNGMKRSMTRSAGGTLGHVEVRVRAGTVGLAGVGHLVGTQNVDGV